MTYGEPPELPARIDPILQGPPLGPVTGGGPLEWRPPERKRDEVIGEALAAYGVGPGLQDDLISFKRGLEGYLARPRTIEALGARAMAAAGGADSWLANLVGVGITPGLLEPEDKARSFSLARRGEPSLTLYVVDPISPDEARALVAASGIGGKREAGQIPLSVVVTGIIEAFSHTSSMRPSAGGCSVGHHKITAGTQGCLAVGLQPPRDQRLLLLSNNHVLANCNSAAAGDAIVQPGPYDAGGAARTIGRLEQFVNINFASGAPNHVDCAVAWVDPAEVRREMLRMAGGAATYFRVSSTPVPAQTTMQVGKTGRTTELTTGQIVDLAASISISYPRVGLAYFQDQIAIRDLNATAFSQPGDSGSLIWTDDPQRSPVGLLFGGGAGRTFANHIDQVLTALDIRLYT